MNKRKRKKRKKDDDSSPSNLSLMLDEELDREELVILLNEPLEYDLTSPDPAMNFLTDEALINLLDKSNDEIFFKNRIFNNGWKFYYLDIKQEINMDASIFNLLAEKGYIFPSQVHIYYISDHAIFDLKIKL
jgi:hypothetical protein